MVGMDVSVRNGELEPLSWKDQCSAQELYFGHTRYVCGSYRFFDVGNLDGDGTGTMAIWLQKAYFRDIVTPDLGRILDIVSYLPHAVVFGRNMVARKRGDVTVLTRKADHSKPRAALRRKFQTTRTLCHEAPSSALAGRYIDTLKPSMFRRLLLALSRTLNLPCV